MNGEKDPPALHEMNSVDKVILFSGEISPGTTSHTDASIDEAGDLVVATQDLGAAPQEIFGDSDYEWWIVVRAASKQELLARLLDQHVERTTAGGRDEEALLYVPTRAPLRRAPLRGLGPPPVAGRERNLLRVLQLRVITPSRSVLFWT